MWGGSIRSLWTAGIAVILLLAMRLSRAKRNRYLTLSDSGWDGVTAYENERMVREIQLGLQKEHADSRIDVDGSRLRLQDSAGRSH